MESILREALVSIFLDHSLAPVMIAFPSDKGILRSLSQVSVVDLAMASGRLLHSYSCSIFIRGFQQWFKSIPYICFSFTYAFSIWLNVCLVWEVWEDTQTKAMWKALWWETATWLGPWTALGSRHGLTLLDWARPLIWPSRTLSWTMSPIQSLLTRHTVRSLLVLP